MRTDLLVAWLSLAVAALPGGGCTTTKACPTIGCYDNFAASVQNADGTLPNGTHRIEILADGATITCSFTFPTATPATASITSCATGTIVSVGPETMCTDTTTQGAVVHQCSPIPGRFIEQINITGAPGQVHVWQYVDDVTILDAAVAPTYQDFSPNGPECGPTCRAATIAWTLQ
jgi:hypothetical protein